MLQNETEIFDLIRTKLSTAVVGDILDVMGLRHQFLPPNLRSLRPNDKLVGRAMPVLEADCATDRIASQNQDAAFGVMFDALDRLQDGDVYICSGSSHSYALWGELMSFRALKLGAAGAVLDGFHRDTAGILALDFPVFSAGSYAQDQRLRGRVIDYGCPIEFSNRARVEPGDLIFGDVDGVLAVPRQRVAEVVSAALDKVVGEETVRRMIQDGRPTRLIWDETGVM
jgi:regulator of RNase E activity RraA